MFPLRLSLVQSDIRWGDKAANLEHFDRLLKPLRGQTDLAVLPEMFTTGFFTDNAQLAESNNEYSMQAVRKWAKDYGFAICGSFLACDAGKVYNRAFFITPDLTEYYYDKRHLFRMGGENLLFSAGDRQVIVPYKGWNILLIVCYDLRFPVWTRNVDRAYDLMICPSNWPEKRNMLWELLLKTRAVENYAYSCGVNRIGEDSHGNNHIGNSLLVDFKGFPIAEGGIDVETVVTGTLDKEALTLFNERFPVWKDADRFELDIINKI
jgi:predicted amidohydrolase